MSCNYPLVVRAMRMKTRHAPPSFCQYSILIWTIAGVSRISNSASLNHGSPTAGPMFTPYTLTTEVDGVNMGS